MVTLVTQCISSMVLTIEEDKGFMTHITLDTRNLHITQVFGNGAEVHFIGDFDSLILTGKAGFFHWKDCLYGLHYNGVLSYTTKESTHLLFFLLLYHVSVSFSPLRSLGLFLTYCLWSGQAGHDTFCYLPTFP